MREESRACPDEGVLQGFHDDLLEESGARRVAEHLAACAACRVEVAELASDDRFFDGVRDLLPSEPPAAHNAERERLEQLLHENSDGERYEVLDELGSGGMGVVFDVRDRVLQRTIAMKVLRAGESKGSSRAASSGRQLARFLREARITGQLDHPSIIPVHELGLDPEGRAFFTMSKVRGRDLHEVFKEFERGEGDWTLQGLVALVSRGCDAVAYAHSKRVVHRDLKPANIMIGRFGAVYVMDWGVATVLDASRADSPPSPAATEVRAFGDLPTDDVRPVSSGLTLDGEVIGTPAYMAPEQALASIEPVDLRADVYSMGAILYRLLARRPPYDDPSGPVSPREAWQRQVHGPPTPLAEAAPDAPTELVAISERAMARNPDERYADMDGLAADLRAWLEGRVVSAYQTGVLAETRKWVRRNRAVAGLAMLVLLAVAVVSSLVARQSQVEARGREAAARAAQVERLIDEDPAEALELAITSAVELEDHLSRSTLLSALESQTLDAELNCLAPRDRLPWFKEGIHRAWSPDGSLLLFGEYQEGHATIVIRVWDVAARRFTEDSFEVETANVHLVFGPEGRRIAAGTREGELVLYDRATKERRELGDGRAHVLAVARLGFSPDGDRLASASWDGTVRVWETATGTLVHTLHGHEGPVTAVEFDESGERLVSASGPSDGTRTTDHTVRVWDAVAGAALLVFQGHDDFITSAHFQPGGNRVLTTSYDRTAQLWDATSGSVHQTMELPGVVWASDFSPDGRTLAVSFDSGFLLRDVDTGVEQRVGRYAAHDGRAVTDVVFAPDGKRLLTVGQDVAGRVWELEPGAAPWLAQVLRGIPKITFCGSWSPDGSRVALTQAHGRRIWFARGSPTIAWAQPSERPALRARVHPDGDRVLLAFKGEPAVEIDFTPGQGLHSSRDLGTAPAVDVATTADGEWTLVAGEGGPVRLWRGGSGAPSEEVGAAELRAASLVPAPTGQVVGAVLEGGGAAVFDPARPSRITRLAEGEDIAALAFSDDAGRVAMGTEDGLLTLVELADGRELWSERLLPASSHNRAVRAAAFDDAGRHLLTAGPEMGVRVWDLESGTQVGTLGSPTTADLVVLREPTRLLSRDLWSFGVNLHEIREGRPTVSLRPAGRPLAHRNRITAWSVDRVRKRLLTVSLDHRATLWDLEQAEAWASFAGHDAPVLAGDLSLDGEWAVTADAHGRVCVWPTDPLSRAPGARAVVFGDTGVL